MSRWILRPRATYREMDSDEFRPQEAGEKQRLTHPQNFVGKYLLRFPDARWCISARSLIIRGWRVIR